MRIDGVGVPYDGSVTVAKLAPGAIPYKYNGLVPSNFDFNTANTQGVWVSENSGLPLVNGPTDPPITNFLWVLTVTVLGPVVYQELVSFSGSLTNTKYSRLGNIGSGVFQNWVSIDGGNSISTNALKDGSVTDVKMASQKVNRAGDTMSAPLLFDDNNNRSKVILAKAITGQPQNAPTTFDKGAIYLQVGGTEWDNNSYRLIGFGWRKYEDSNHAPAVLGYQEVAISGNTYGRLLFGTRDSLSDIAPNIRMTIEPNGQILLETGYVPGSDYSVSSKKYVDDKKATTQADSTATDVAGLVTDFNALLAKLKAANLMA